MDRRTPAAALAVGAARRDAALDIEYRFRLLGAGAEAAVGGWPPPRSRPAPASHRPARAVDDPDAPVLRYAARDAAWRLLVQRARTGDPAWRAGAIGVALPGLRFKAYLLAKLFTGDVQAAIVEHFLRALGTVDVARPGVVGNLLSAAFSKARAELRDQEPASSGAPNHASGAVLPPAPYGHPDLVLARAVNAGVISGQEAELIGATYLEEVRPHRARRGHRPAPLDPVQAARRRRGPAEGGDRVR
ncbi:hypothetical protein [Salinispora arenicola]|uniref:hypothetical protein n=1 Tax=Salinispora arenicola TaxID=168697 RepID=UPI0027DBE629|nr:hypothetical protein [Salinispora arenicola]